MFKKRNSLVKLLDDTVIMSSLGDENYVFPTVPHLPTAGDHSSDSFKIHVYILLVRLVSCFFLALWFPAEAGRPRPL